MGLTPKKFLEGQRNWKITLSACL